MIEVVITVLIVYFLYYFVSIKRFDKAGHYKNAKEKKISDYEALPSEVKYFITKYKIDTNKINYKPLLKLLGLILGIDIAVLTIICVLIFQKNTVLILIVAAILIIPLYLLSISFVGKYFKKKGLVKNE